MSDRILLGGKAFDGTLQRTQAAPPCKQTHDNDRKALRRWGAHAAADSDAIIVHLEAVEDY